MRAICILTMFLGGFALAEERELRTWRDQETAQAIVAELVAVEGDKITLRTENGRKYTLPVDRFHRDDKAYVERWQQEKEEERKYQEEMKKREEEEKNKPKEAKKDDKKDDRKKEEEKKPAEPFMEKREKPKAQTRTYTSVDGKQLEAEVLLVKEGKALLKLAGNRKVNIPVARLTEADRTYLEDWAAKNPYYSLNALRFDVRKKRGAAERTDKDGNSTKKTEVKWMGLIRNNTREPIEGISVAYTVYERVTKDEGRSSSEKIEIKDYTDNVGKIEAGKDYEFESTALKEESSSKKGDKKKKIDPTSTRRQIEGVVFTVKVKDRELIVHSDPQGFLEKLEVEQKRWEEKQAREEAKRKKD